MGREWGEDDPTSPGTSQRGPWACRSLRLPVAWPLLRVAWVGRRPTGRSPLARRCGAQGAPILPPTPTPVPLTTAGPGMAREPHRRCKAEEAVAAAF